MQTLEERARWAAVDRYYSAGHYLNGDILPEILIGNWNLIFYLHVVFEIVVTPHISLKRKEPLRPFNGFLTLQALHIKAPLPDII